MPAIAPVLTNVSKTKRPDTLSFDYLTAFTFGPKDVGDSSLGPYNRPWRVRATTLGEVWIAKANDTNDAWEAETLLFTYTGEIVSEIDIAFDQAARPVVVAERAGHVWIYFFDSVPAAFTFTNFGVGRNPRCALDSPLEATISDVLLFYMNDTTGFMSYRMQRDRYLVEYSTGLGITADYYLEEAAFSTDNRLQLWYSQRNETTGRITKNQLQTVLYAYAMTDSFKAGAVLEGGGLPVVVLGETMDTESWKAAALLQSGILGAPVIIYTMYDLESFKAGAVLRSGILISPVIIYTVFDLDQWKAGANFTSGSLVLVVIVHSLFDLDQWKAGANLLSGILA
jgi:hypothetical protein